MAARSQIGRLVHNQPDSRGIRVRRSIVQTYNGMPASGLREASWCKSDYSNPNGSCVEVAELPGGAIAVRPAMPAVLR